MHKLKQKLKNKRWLYIQIYNNLKENRSIDESEIHKVPIFVKKRNRVDFLNRKMFIVHNYLHHVLFNDEVSKYKWRSYLIEEILIQLNLFTSSIGKPLYKLLCMCSIAVLMENACSTYLFT